MTPEESLLVRCFYDLSYMDATKKIVIIGFWILVGWYIYNHFFATKNEYSGFFYPNAENLENSVSTGSYESLEDCRQSVLSLMKYHRTNKPEVLSIEESQSMKSLVTQLGETPINTSESSGAYNVFTALGKVGFDAKTGDYTQTFTEPDGECGYKCRYDSDYGLNICKETYGVGS